MTRVAALYVCPKGPYYRLPNVDPWDKNRDARNYSGPYPVVAHPPCQLWVAFAHVNYKRWGGEHNRPGNDGGCFKAALECVRKWGGVLEHPAGSQAWAAHGLQKPIGFGWSQTAHNEGVCEVWQSAYGHKARKRTWLFYSSPAGHTPYGLDWTREPGTHQIGGFDIKKPVLSKKEAILTPPKFAEVLVCLAHRAGYGL